MCLRDSKSPWWCCSGGDGGEGSLMALVGWDLGGLWDFLGLGPVPAMSYPMVAAIVEEAQLAQTRLSERGPLARHNSQ